MQAELQRRILRAVTACTERLHRRLYRQMLAPQPNKKGLEDHGPQIIGAHFSTCLEQLTDRRIQRTPEAADVEACRRLLSGFIQARTAEYAPTQEPSQRPTFSTLLEQRLQPAMHPGGSIGLTLLRTILRLPKGAIVGSVETWDHWGFYLFHDLLSEAYPEPSADRFEKILVNARLLAYILSALEDACALEDLLLLKNSLTALAAGVVPIAYTPRTKILDVGNWYR